MITINNSKQPPNWVKYIILVLIIILGVAIYKGCVRFSKRGGQAIDTEGRIARLVKDSIEASYELIDLKNQVQVIDGQLGVAKNKESIYMDSFRVLNDHINNLKKRYKQVAPSNDTSVTVVPNDYIIDCADCFITIEKAQQLGTQYKADLDHVKSLNRSKIDLLSNKVSVLEKQNVSLNKNYRSLLDSVSNKKTEIRRTLFFNVGTMAISQHFPNAIGAGFLYEDKKRRIYGAKYYISEYGSIYQVDLSLPLSLKFK